MVDPTVEMKRNGKKKKINNKEGMRKSKAVSRNYGNANEKIRKR